MNSRFVLPAMVSTAFYALVFSLGNGTHTPRPVKPPPLAPADANHTLVTIIEPEDEVVDVSISSVKRGSPDKDSYRPPSADTPLAPRDFTQPFEPIPVPNNRPGITTTIPSSWGPPGVQGDPNGILPSSMLDNEPRDRARVAPVYPEEARRGSLTGEVLVEFVVDTAGRVSHAQIIRSTNSIFDEPTLRAVERWRFEPGKRHGRAVPFRMSVPIVFGLDNS